MASKTERTVVNAAGLVQGIVLVTSPAASTVSFGETALTAVSAAVAGGIIAFYQLGYGIAAFGVGPLKHAGVSLPAIFGFTAVIAAAMALLSFVITRRRPALVEPAAGSAVPMPRSSRDHAGGSSDRSGARRFQ